MAKTHGFGGVIKVDDTSAVGELQSWNLDQQAVATEGYSMGDAWASNEGSVKKWSGSAEAYFDPADAGQTSLEAGDTVALHFYPGGEASGQPTRSGNVLITGNPISANKDGWVSVTFNFVGDGPLTSGTVV
jgi:hypothetical protein